MSDVTRRPGIPRPIPVVALFALTACSSVDELNDFLSDIDVDFDAGGDATGTDTDLDTSTLPDSTTDTGTPDTAPADTSDDATDPDVPIAEDATDATDATTSDATTDAATDTTPSDATDAATDASDTAADAADTSDATDADGDTDSGTTDVFALISEALEDFVRLQCDGRLTCNPDEFQTYYASVDACVGENMYQAEYFAEVAESPEDCAAALEALSDCAEAHSICAGEGAESYFYISYADCNEEFDAQYYACYAPYEYEEYDGY